MTLGDREFILPLTLGDREFIIPVIVAELGDLWGIYVLDFLSENDVIFNLKYIKFSWILSTIREWR